MKIEIRENPDQKQKMFIKAEAIMRYISAKSEDLDTLIMCKAENIDMLSNDYELYKALGSIEKKTEIDYNRLVKFLEVVDINSYKSFHQKKKPILTEKDVEELNTNVNSAADTSTKDEKNEAVEKKGNEEKKSSGGDKNDRKKNR